MVSKTNVYGTSKVNPELMGKRIRKIREDHQLTQRRLAKTLGISQTLLGFFERGQRRVPIHILLEISKIGDVSLDWLVTGREYKKKQKR